MTYFDKWIDSDGATVLRVGGGWSTDIEDALKTIPFDALTIGPGMQGGFCDFEPHAGKIHWIKGANVHASFGLEKLEFLERIDLFDVVPEPIFDYRRLTRLRALTCSNAARIPVKYLNHPSVELLDVHGLKLKEFDSLIDAVNLRAVRLVATPIRSMDGIAALNKLVELRVIQARSLEDISALSLAASLEILELDKTPNISDISAVYGLTNLRRIYIDGRKARQKDLSWIGNMPKLESASIFVETETIDWSVFSEHPCLYDIIFYTNRDYLPESDEEIIKRLSSSGRRVKSLKRYPKGPCPAFGIEFFPNLDIENPFPQSAFRTNLQYSIRPSFKSRTV